MFKSPQRKRGFTLVELMIVVGVLGVLATVAVPKFGGMLRNSKEGDAKSKLGIMRAALNIYFAENLARFPVGPNGDNQTTLATCLVPKYLPSIPSVRVYPYHDTVGTVDNVATNDFVSADSSDDGEWVYLASEANTDWGLLSIECYHADSKGIKWSAY